jgi:hypothetical protein
MEERGERMQQTISREASLNGQGTRWGHGMGDVIYKMTAELAEADRVWTPGWGGRLIQVSQIVPCRSVWPGLKAWQVTATDGTVYQASEEARWQAAD